MANIIVPDSGEGSIDRELLRDKFTGRSNLFFSPDNAGGVRSGRRPLNFQPEILQLDPAVKYRAFSSQTAADDFLKTGLIAGRGSYENALFFNQGVPLLSYAQTSVPNQRFLLATLGDNWGDRAGHTFGTKGMQGGLSLDAAKDAAAFSVNPPIVISDNPYTEKIGDLSAPDLKGFKTLKDLAKYAKGLDLKYVGKAAGTEKGLPRPVLRPDRRITQEDYDKEHIPKLRQIKSEVTKIADYLLSENVQNAIKQLNDKRNANPTAPPNPLLEYYENFFRTIDDGHLRGIQDQNHGGRYPVTLPAYDESDRDIFDSSPENIKKLKAGVKTSIDGFLDSTISKDWIVPFDRQLNYFPDGVRDGKLPNAYGTFTEPTPLELKYLQKYRKEGSTYLQHGVPQHTAGVMNNPHLNPYGIEGFATTARSLDLASFLETTRKFFDPAKFHTTFSVDEVPDYLPFGGFTAQNGDGTLTGAEWLDNKAQPVMPMTPQEGLYASVPPQVKPTLTTPLGTNLLRMNPSDERVFSSPQGVLHNLDNVFDQTLSSWGKQTKIRNLEIPSMGLGGAMYSEVLPTSEIVANYIDPETNQPRKWQTLAPFINPQDGNRPTVMFQIMDDGTYKLVKEFNNEPTSEGWKPIPTGTLSPEKRKEAYVRYLQEMTGDVSKGRTELLGLKGDIFSEIYPELPKDLQPDQVQAAFANLTEEQLGAAAARLMARGISPSQIIDSKYGNYGNYLPQNQEYLKLGGLVDEATRGNPQYGRKGFINLNPVTTPFKNLNKWLNEIPLPQAPFDTSRMVMPQGQSIDWGRTIIEQYKNNPAYRAQLNASSLAKLGTVAAIATTPFDAVNRRNTNLEALANSGLSPAELERYTLPVAIGSGLEPAANLGTMGLYDQFSPTPSAAQARKSNIETLLNIATRVALTPLEIRRWLQESGNESK